MNIYLLISNETISGVHMDYHGVKKIHHERGYSGSKISSENTCFAGTNILPERARADV